MRLVFKEPLVLSLQKLRVQEKEGRIEAVLFPEMVRMTSTAKTGEGWERSRAHKLGRWEL